MNRLNQCLPIRPTQLYKAMLLFFISDLIRQQWAYWRASPGPSPSTWRSSCWTNKNWFRRFRRRRPAKTCSTTSSSTWTSSRRPISDWDIKIQPTRRWANLKGEFIVAISTAFVVSKCDFMKVKWNKIYSQLRYQNRL